MKTNIPEISPFERSLFESWELMEKYNMYKSISPACRHCPNHPINGGSGVCNCIMGLPKITC